MTNVSRTTCAIVGGGPAGVVLGLLLARGGVDVTVLERHEDFNRDFRGDTVHASTIRLLDELGLGTAFRAIPQSRLDDFRLPLPDGSEVTLGEFSRLRPPYDHVAMVPQWDLLDMLVRAASQEPTFTIRMGVTATDVIVENGRVTGVQLSGPGDEVGELRADLVVACDGRNSRVRAAAGLVPVETRVPFDTWWFRLPLRPGDARSSLAPRFAGHDVMLSFPRRDYHQVAYFAAKGSDARLRAEGLDAFRARIAALRPDFADRLDALTSMDEVHVLDVRMNRLRRWWRDGLLCIGDAAHAMSPAGGVGINLAVQDAVAAAAILQPVLGRPGPNRAAGIRAADDRTAAVRTAGVRTAGVRTAGVRAAGDRHRDALAPSLRGACRAVQRRRTLPTRIVQGAQRVLHRVVFQAALDGRLDGPPPVATLLARHVPASRGFYARGIAFGPLPEHAPDFARRPDPSTASTRAR